MHDQDYTTRPRRRSRRRDEYYSDEEPSRHSRRRDDDYDYSSDGLYEERRNIEEWTRRSEAPSRRNPEIHIDGVPQDSSSHIYPPPPVPMMPPYPTSGALVPMPPDAPYPLQRSLSDQPHSRDLSMHDDYDDYPGRGRGGVLTRSRSAHDDGGRRRSYEQLDRGHDDQYIGARGLLTKHDHDGRKFNHVTAGLAGAFAGGYLGKKVSQGDTMATVAGALVGALGASVAEREWERRERKEIKERRRKRERDPWDRGSGHRY